MKKKSLHKSAFTKKSSKKRFSSDQGLNEDSIKKGISKVKIYLEKIKTSGKFDSKFKRNCIKKSSFIIKVV